MNLLPPSRSRDSEGFAPPVHRGGKANQRDRAGLHPGDGGAGQGWSPWQTFQLEKLDAETVRQVLTPPRADAVFCSDGAGVYASFSQAQGHNHQVVRNRQGNGNRGRVSHPACKRISPSAERVDGAIPWGSDALSEELSGLAEDVGALWAGSDIPHCLHEALGRPMQHMDTRGRSPLVRYCIFNHFRGRRRLWSQRQGRCGDNLPPHGASLLIRAKTM